MTRGNKTIVMAVQANANYQLGKHKSGTVTLVDDVDDNPLPTVTIINPINNAPFGYPASISITADACDGGTNISSVSFYADDEFSAASQALLTRSPGRRPGSANTPFCARG